MSSVLGKFGGAGDLNKYNQEEQNRRCDAEI